MTDQQNNRLVQLDRAAIGTWSGGRFMHFGEVLTEDEYFNLFRKAWEMGMRTFITSDVYGNGQADELLGKALSPFPRERYKLVGMIGHDFYQGKRTGNRGYPRFTCPDIRDASDYANFMQTAVNESLKRCNTDHFDLLLLHNPDERGYTSHEVWNEFGNMKLNGLTQAVGSAPGPANGFVLDLIHAFRTFGDTIDWCMAILNPLEPWPSQDILDEAKAQNGQVLTRVADHGGVLFGDVPNNHEFGQGDHRTYRPEGWVEHANARVDKMRPIAEKHGLTMIQLSALWALSQEPVKSVVPTFIREKGGSNEAMFDKIQQLVDLPKITLSKEEIEAINVIGENAGCMHLKGASSRHSESLRPDEWPLRPELASIAEEISWNTAW